MKMKLIWVLCIFLFMTGKELYATARKEVFLEIIFPQDKKIDSVLVRSINWKPNNYSNQYRLTKFAVQNGIASCRIRTVEPVGIMIPELRSLGFLLAPWDSICIDTRNEAWTISGKGKEKAELMYRIIKQVRVLPVPLYDRAKTKRQMTLADFSEWDIYLNQIAAIHEKELGLFKQKIPVDEFLYTKATLVCDVEHDRLSHFNKLLPTLGQDRLCKIYDKTISGNKDRKWLFSQTEDLGRYNFYYSAVISQLRRNRGFGSSGLSGDEASLNRRKEAFEEARKMYKGWILANALHNLVGHEGMMRYSGMDSLLQVFYKMPEVPEILKKDMRRFEEIARKGKDEKTIGVRTMSSNDGPYLLKQRDGSVVYEFSKEKILKSVLSKKGIFLNIDGKKKVIIPIQKLDQVNSDTFQKPSKLLALSDIEGSFEAFQKLLIANGVINSNFEWTFGNGHLVLLGDFFDRGSEVTECLWLIYLLEEKAKAAGGYVHYILGNHEIMNLTGDVRYVHAKYIENAKKIGVKYQDLYGKDSELGRWLRTKNVVEKIGEVLFTHAGVSAELNRLNLSMGQINILAREFIDKKTDVTEAFNTVNSSGVGPYWYRGYYKNSDKKMMNTVIDSTLQLYNVKRIITGHSIVADTISVHFDKKVIDTDVHHASGKSEALLIEGSNYYRVNAQGKKMLLFKEEEK